MATLTSAGAVSARPVPAEQAAEVASADVALIHRWVNGGTVATSSLAAAFQRCADWARAGAE